MLAKKGARTLEGTMELDCEWLDWDALSFTRSSNFLFTLSGRLRGRLKGFA
jgi:hypothetical protein